MKKIKHYALLLFTVVAVFGCSKDDDNTDPTSNVKVEKVEIAPTSLDLIAAEEKTLTVTITPSDANQNVTWTSSNEAVATVKDGTVKGVAQGETTITVTTEDGGLTATCKVTVTEQTNGYPWYIAGKESSSFEISTLEELKQFGLLVNGDKAAMALNGESGTVVTFSGKTVILKNDMNLNNEEWAPIGNSDFGFRGIFDGNGKTISGLKVTKANNGQEKMGFFSYTVSATIKNLKISGGTISSYHYAGGVVGYSSKSIIENCSSSVSVLAQAASGGIAGEIRESTIKGCYSTGDITVTGEGVGNTNPYAGGIAGAISNNSSVQACYYTTGTVTGGNALVNGSAVTGGIVGIAFSTEKIYNCYFTGTVVAGTSQLAVYTGGVIGSYVASSTGGSLLYISGRGANRGIGERPTDITSIVKSIASESQLSANISFLNTGLPGEVGYQFKADGTLEKVQ